MSIRRVGVLAATLFVAALVIVLAYRLGWWRFSYPDASQFPIQGIDVSHHQGLIDWDAVSNHGVAFAFIKASEGSTFVDPRFNANSSAAHAADIPWAPYHFFTFCTSGADQAEHFGRVISSKTFQLPPAIDIEFIGNCKNWREGVTTKL